MAPLADVSRQPRKRRVWLRRLGAFCLITALLPFALTLVYSLVPPVSMPMRFDFTSGSQVMVWPCTITLPIIES